MHAGWMRTSERAKALVADRGDVRRRCAVTLACAMVLVMVRPAPAHAGWPLAAPAPVVLAFGAVYSAGDAGAQHRGVDLAAEAGETVIAPLSGRVSFVGRVPGVGGGRVTAVSIETSLGRVTLLPLTEECVSRGAEVEMGEAIGVLAGVGDGSSAVAHLHVGVRRGDLYVDPLGILAPPSAPSAVPGAGVGVGVSAPAPTGASAGVPADVGGGVPAGAGPAPAAGNVNATKASGRRPVVVSGELAPGVSVAVRGGVAGGAVAAGPPATSPGGAGTSVQPIRAPRVAATAAGAQEGSAARDTSRQPRGPVWASEIVTRVRDVAERSVRVGGLVLLGAMAALGALWPLWRDGPRKGSRKVLVTAVGEDVAAAPSR